MSTDLDFFDPLNFGDAFGVGVPLYYHKHIRYSLKNPLRITVGSEHLYDESPGVY